MYNRIGLAGVLLIDVIDLCGVASLLFCRPERACVVVWPVRLNDDIVVTKGNLEPFGRKMQEGLTFLREQPLLVLLGISWWL